MLANKTELKRLENCKATNIDLKVQVKRVDAFCEIEHQLYITNTLLPYIKKCTDNIDFYKN